MARRRFLYGCAVIAALWCNVVAAQSLSAGAAQWPPYSFIDKNGQATGIAVDVMRQVMAKSGDELQFVFHPAKRLNILMDEGRVDINYADSPEWNPDDAAQRFVYSQPYLKVREYLYFLDDHPARHLPIEQLRGLRIGMVRGYTYRTLDAALRNGQLSKLETSRDPALLDLLLRGRVDAIAQIDDVFDDQLASRGLPPQGFARGAQLSDAPLVIKLQRQHADQLPRLNAALQGLVSSGEVERIRRSYLRVSPIKPASTEL